MNWGLIKVYMLAHVKMEDIPTISKQDNDHFHASDRREIKHGQIRKN